MVNNDCRPVYDFEFGDGEGNQRGKKEKKKEENLEKIKLLTIPNHKNMLVKHNLTLIKP